MTKIKEIPPEEITGKDLEEVESILKHAQELLKDKNIVSWHLAYEKLDVAMGLISQYCHPRYESLPQDQKLETASIELEESLIPVGRVEDELEYINAPGTDPEAAL